MIFSCGLRSGRGRVSIKRCCNETQPSGVAAPANSRLVVRLGFLLVVFETSIAKMRVFRVPDFLGIALMLGLLGVLLLFVSRSF